MNFIENLNWRYATREFNGKKIETNILEKILTSIRMTPSAFGVQPYHITVVENIELKKTLKPYTWNQDQIDTCSHLLVFSADLDTEKRVDDYLKLAAEAKLTEITDDPEYDYRKEFNNFVKKMGPEWSAKQTYIALGFALAACAELKIDSCPIEGFEPENFKKVLNLPKNLEPKFCLAIGYRSSNDTHIKSPKIRFSKKNLFDFR